MFDERQYKSVAPDVDYLLRYFDRHGMMNPTESTEALLAAFEKLWSVLASLAPLAKNEEAKTIWLRIPRGTIEDYGNCNYTFEEAQDYGEVNTYEEYENNWKYEYPDELAWYELTVVKSFEKDGSLRFYGVILDHKTIISALTDNSYGESNRFEQDAAVNLCDLILPAAQESIDLLKAGRYNDLVESSLPYHFRTGVIRRADLCDYDSDYRARDFDGLSEEAVDKFKSLISSGINDVDRISCIRDFTANDFFKACKIGYEAIGKDCSKYTLPELYQRYADGRDEGLTGMRHGLNAGPGIDFDSPTAWNEWYNGNRGGGHPWEVVPGGNSTHMELFVRNKASELDYELRAGRITQAEYDEKISRAGYYFEIAGMQRQFESVSFYIALSEAGLPVVIAGAEELLARFEATDYVGIVPHHLPTRYCESLFPDSYGTIIDFTHVYKGEDPWFDKITWLPEDKAEIN